MAFAILGGYFLSNSIKIKIIIDNKTCVNKTFPFFWNHIQMNYGIIQKFEDFERENLSKINIFEENDPFFLIGMRKVGKTTLGKILSEFLKWKFFDTDQIIFQKFEKLYPKIKNLKEVILFLKTILNCNINSLYQLQNYFNKININK